MGRQLNILALEGFYGGVRKQTLDLLCAKSRHHWHVLKLPPRRLERRLTTAAQWFAQQVTRMPVPKCDIVFASDAVNLADFLRIKSDYGKKPAVAYFHCNQLSGDAASEPQAQLSVLATASSSTEMWFSSLFHMRDFLRNVAAMFEADKDVGGKEQLKDLVAKGQLMHPPVQIVPPTEPKAMDADRKSRTLCLDNRAGARVELFTALLKKISERREPVSLHVLGSQLTDVPSGIPVTHTDAKNEQETMRSMRRCEIYVSSQPCDEFDPLAMRAMAMGCIPILPEYGFYSEFVPDDLRAWCMYDGTSADLLSRIMDLWFLKRPAVAREDLTRIFDRYTPANAAAAFDRRLEYLVEAGRKPKNGPV